jgi:cytochrome P450
MMLYPDVQRRAQAEIDDVVGQDRFPTFEDRDKLPYIAAIIQEVGRWAPVAPQGQTHAFCCRPRSLSATKGSRTGR